jgi:protoporphyrinogen oxidase
MSGSRSRIAVVGAGATGLVAAYRLLQQGHEVRIYEAGPGPGGLLRTFPTAGDPVECFYHHLFTSDKAAIRLFEELGLGGRLVWHPSRLGIFYEGRIYPFTTALDLLRFAPVSLIDRFRLGLMALRLSRRDEGPRFDNVTAVDWIRDAVGERALDVVWRPLLRGKFGNMADRVTMAWLWNKVHLRFQSRKTPLAGSELLGYLTGSFQLWIETIVERVRSFGGEIRTSTPVAAVRPVREGLVVETERGDEQYDAVIVTVCNRRFLEMAPPLGEAYEGRLRAVPYQDALCLVLTLKRPLTRYYWLNVSDAEVPFIAVVEHTNLVASERYGGEHIVYLADYVAPESSAVRQSAEEALANALPHLRRINPAFERSWVKAYRLFHGRDAQPVFTVGAASLIPGQRTPVPGLYLANMGQIYPQDRGQNYAIALGEKVASIVAEDLARRLVAQYQV